MNRSHGRVKTKKPMSRPNCASLVPNGTRLCHSEKICHWLAAAEPANRPSRAGATTVATRRSGSSISR